MFLALLRSELAADPARLFAALRGLRVYQDARRDAAMEALPVVARAGRASLRDAGGQGAPVLFVPSLINPPDVLDLSSDRSLLRWLAGRGHRALLLDWGTPGPGERALSIGGHVESLLLPVLDQLGPSVTLVGYCLGGTMAIAAAALRPVRGLVLLATPWHFGRYPATTLAQVDDFWGRSAAASDALGLLPMEMLQAIFWSLDTARTAAKFVDLAARGADDPALPGFVRLEDWANDGPPLTFGAARELFDDLYGLDLPGRGRWQVSGTTIDPARIAAPILDIASTVDRIVPAATALGRGERIELSLGHVGMVVGSRAPAALWQPLAAWLSRLR